MIGRVVLTAVTIVMMQMSAMATEACAHRGDVAVAPENTIPAFVSAVEKGAGMIEFDVQLSKDGRLVIMHDATVNRTTDGTGPVSSLAFEQLRALDAGSWYGDAFAGARIPTLREALESIPEHIVCNVHLKNSVGLAVAAAKKIEELGRLEQCFLACTVEQATEAKKAVPSIRVCNMSRQGGDRQAYVDLTFAKGSDFIQLHLRNGVAGIGETVRELHNRGVQVNYFGTEDPEEIRLLQSAGVDYILTDDLDVCLKTLLASENKGP